MHSFARAIHAQHIACARARTKPQTSSSSPSSSRVAPPAFRAAGTDSVRGFTSTVRAVGEREDGSNAPDTIECEREFEWSKPGYRGAMVSALDERAQAVVVVAAWLAVCAGTFECVTVIGPALERAAPSIMAWSKSTWPIIGVTYIAAGIAHFAVHDGFVAMMPHRGAWGIWNLPGSKSFHVNWTGVAEILGGTGLMLGSLPFDIAPELRPLTPISAAALAALSMAVYPANLYMWTHNSPGPLPPNADESMLTLPWQGHLARAGLQVFLMSLLIGLARS